MAEFKKNNSIMEGTGEQDVEAKTLSGNQDVFLRLPYGLAKKEGIDTTGMTPKQVWEALKGKGFNPQQEMDKLARSFRDKQKVDTAELLKQKGLSVWQGGDKVRIYLKRKDVDKLFGLKYTKYKTGNVSSASLNGKAISNSWARDLLAATDKVYYDVAAKKFVIQVSWGGPSIREYAASLEKDLNKLSVEDIDTRL